MAAKEHDVWLERFRRECRIKSSVILSGNTNDIICNQLEHGVYQSVMNTVLSNLRDIGFSIIKWDRVDGIDHDASSNLPDISTQTTPTQSANAYDVGPMTIPSTVQQQQGQTYKNPDDFFPYLLSVLKNGNARTAFVLDYSDYLFGNANSLSEKERQYLATLGKALEEGQSYDLLRTDQANNIVVIVTQNHASIPPAYYLHNAEVALINIPLPGRTEREMFLAANMPMLRVSPDISMDRSLQDDFIDALDGFKLKEIVQLMKLSRSLDNEVLSCEKLINLYKYGEKVSPWEELSKDKLENVKARLGERVKGQDEAINKVKDVLIRAYTGFSGLQHSSKQKKPKGTLFFVGPTGVGKTELAKSLAEFVFGDENACIRFDMSEYNHEHSDQRLVGAPPGYVGYEAGGQLTNAVKEKPFCVLLFDEIEKAHGKILDKFLQILEDGRLTDGKGETVSFSESIIIFTSNLGAANVSSKLEPKEIRAAFISEVKKHFIEELGRPELLNRIGDNIVAFNFIRNEEVFAQIARVKMKTIVDFVHERYKADLVFEDEDTAFKIIARLAGIENGGRGLLNIIETCIVNPLSDFIFKKSEYITGRRIVVSTIQDMMFDFNLE